MPTVTTLKENLIRLPEVMRRTGYGKAWIYRLIETGQFPKSVKIGTRSIAFVESEVDEWVANKIAESRTGEVA
ncbi:helix-turn-helix transcriptional regulator [Providencia hangzhouensis]|uniref:AlpA family phage regulatory protein n=5 Tax=Providencia TaxID=586 RepID=A0A264VXW8_PRORE|nr:MULTISPECIES: AlpA family transcriptional regulator [Morganellaceae]USR63994.1 AlpA family transcriptional regulator [Providencia stuartii]AXH64442.1 AlpA family transcriptional regulator [Providencia huaxiensis]EHZ7763075.1 AlpA family transcriptional regulator [Providencia rettgeri]EIJ7166217.1 AlpA family transcriptional regulator [Providencia rettgeri]EJD6046040.1 AlpA family transcriptional regulator [Providencia rettgeri]